MRYNPYPKSTEERSPRKNSWAETIGELMWDSFQLDLEDYAYSVWKFDENTARMIADTYLGDAKGTLMGQAVEIAINRIENENWDEAEALEEVLEVIQARW